MTAFNGYPVSILLSVLLHGLVIAVVLFIQRGDTEAMDVVEPPSVEASLVAENPQARNERVQEEQAEQRRIRQQREEQQAEQRRREEEEQRRQEQQRQEEEQQQREEEQRQQELERQREEEQQRREEEEQRRQEEEQRREEERRRQEEQRRQEEAERQRRQEEQAAQEAAEEANAEAVQSYTSVIHDLVQQNWSRPPSARNGMEAVLRIHLLPTGEVQAVEIVESSGDAAFDRSAENAVHAVGRFRELQGMPPRLFERNFRTLLLTFRPEDLLN